MEMGFKVMTSLFTSFDQFIGFLFNNIAIPKNKNGKLMVPFGEITEWVLWDREADNIFKEDFALVQYSCFGIRNALKKRLASKECFEQTKKTICAYHTELKSQLSSVLDILEKTLDPSLLYVGGITFNADVFIAIYRLLLGLYVMQSFSEVQVDKEDCKKLFERLKTICEPLNPFLSEIIEILKGKQHGDREVFFLLEEQ